MTNKERILELIGRLPDDVSLDRAIDELSLLRKIEEGLHRPTRDKWWTTTNLRVESSKPRNDGAHCLDSTGDQ